MSHAEAHPLRGALALAGGLLVGLGLGLAFGNVPAGSITGVGAGMLLAAVLRAFAKW
jgi:hypothetical protein